MKFSMKKVLLLLCVVIAGCMLVTSCANGGGKSKSVFNTASEAYAEINAAYEIVDEYGSDIYNAWMSGIYDDDEMDIEFLADETGIPEADLRAGYEAFFGESPDEYFNYFDFCLDNDDFPMFSLCTLLVSEAYKVNGKSEEVKAHLDNAKAIMKDMSENYSDYEHYSNLKGFYTKTNAYFDYCESPDGSFEQCKTTVNEYRNQIRDFKNDLDYIFEE